ncbi:MAG: ferredoxin [Sporichthyaceae bacterium]
MTFRITVDADSCISSAKCIYGAPQLMRFDADEIAQTIPGALPASAESALALARNCPGGALHVFDDDQEIDLW